MEEKIKICLVGAGFIGKKHAEVFSQLKDAKLQIICDKNKDLAKQLADEYNFERIETDWHKAVQASDVELVCVCVSNNMHYSIVSEAIKSGKHICCEKPLGMNKEESENLCKQVKEKGIIANCCYNLIHVPAIKYAHKIIQSGILGDVVCFRGTYDNDRLANPEEKFEWRMLKKNAIGGSLCDLAINILAISQYLVGDIVSVSGMSNIIHPKRKDFNGNLVDVENDDVAQFICRYKNSAMGYISSNRVANGSKQDMKFEVQLTKGTVRFSLECMNEVQIYKFGDDGFTKVISNNEGWFCKGYEELKKEDASILLNNIKNKIQPDNDFVFASKIDKVIESVLESIDKKEWVKVDE